MGAETDKTGSEVALEKSVKNLARVERAKGRAVQARTDAILAAHADGMSAYRIAKITGLTQQRVGQILKDTPRRKIMSKTEQDIRSAFQQAEDEATEIRTGIDWDTAPAEVRLDGIRVDVEVRTAYMPAIGGGSVNEGTAHHLTLEGYSGVDLDSISAVDLGHTVITAGGIAVFQPAYLDAALVYLVRQEQDRRAKKTQDAEEREAALSELAAAKKAADDLAGQGGVAMRALEDLRATAQGYYDRSVITEADAEIYTGPWLRR